MWPGDRPIYPGGGSAAAAGHDDDDAARTTSVQGTASVHLDDVDMDDDAANH
jgi:hypothetical protein